MSEKFRKNGENTENDEKNVQKMKKSKKLKNLKIWFFRSYVLLETVEILPARD